MVSNGFRRLREVWLLVLYGRIVEVGDEVEGWGNCLVRQGQRLIITGSKLGFPSSVYFIMQQLSIYVPLVCDG